METLTYPANNHTPEAVMTPEEVREEILSIKVEWERIGRRMANIKRPIPAKIQQEYDNTGQRIKALEDRFFNK